MTRDDVERIIENKIQERELMTRDEFLSGISIHVRGGDFTCPNDRTVTLKFNGVEINSAYFDVVQQNEYPG